MPRGDGRLSHDLDPHSPGPQDACGVFGVWAPGEEVAKLTYFGLYALQHRGQEAAGIAVSDGAGVVVFKDLGLVAQVFDEPTLASLRGHIAIGHAPLLHDRRLHLGERPAHAARHAGEWARTRGGTTIALAHNGNLVNTAELARRRSPTLRPGRGTATSDTALVTALLAARPDLSVEAAALEVLPTLRGAFSFVFMDEDTLYAARDPQGVRPLVLGRLERGWVVASETAALDIVGASFVREIEPGELIAIDEHGLRSNRFATPEPKGCLFEYVYLARPDTTIAGRNVYAARVAIGRRSGQGAPGRGRPGHPGARVGHPGRDRLRRRVRHPVRRRSGQERLRRAAPSSSRRQTIRQLGIRLKLNPLRDDHPRQADRGRRRLDRAGQHPAGAGPDAARGRARSRSTCGSRRRR